MPSHGTDPQEVANNSALGGPPPDRFGLARGGSEEAFAAEDVRLLLVREPRFAAVLDAAGRWERARTFGPWVLYRPRAEAGPPVAKRDGRGVTPSPAPATPRPDPTGTPAAAAGAS